MPVTEPSAENLNAARFNNFRTQMRSYLSRRLQYIYDRRAALGERGDEVSYNRFTGRIIELEYLLCEFEKELNG